MSRWAATLLLFAACGGATESAPPPTSPAPPATTVDHQVQAQLDAQAQQRTDAQNVGPCLHGDATACAALSPSIRAQVDTALAAKRANEAARIAGEQAAQQVVQQQQAQRDQAVARAQTAIAAQQAQAAQDATPEGQLRILTQQICAAYDQKDYATQDMATERANPSGVIDLVRLHDDGGMLQQANAVIQQGLPIYQRASGKPFDRKVCPAPQQ